MGAVTDPEQVLYVSPTVLVGSWRCPPDHPRFPGGWTERPLAVFPRTSCIIAHAGHDPVLSDPNTVMLYDADIEYARRRVDPVGDRCEFLSLDSAAWEELAGPTGGSAAAPFGTDHGSCPPWAYVAQRQVFAHLTGPEPVDALFVEETVLAVLAATTAAVAHARRRSTPGRRPSARTLQAHRAMVEGVKEHLATRFADPVTLAEVAHAVGASPFHLARVFRQQVGTSVHTYLTEQRLRRSLELIGGDDLAAVAAEVGFSSHSHYTAAFRRLFGTTPSQMRTMLTAEAETAP